MVSRNQFQYCLSDFMYLTILHIMHCNWLLLLVELFSIIITVILYAKIRSVGYMMPLNGFIYSYPIYFKRAYGYTGSNQVVTNSTWFLPFKGVQIINFVTSLGN